MERFGFSVCFFFFKFDQFCFLHLARGGEFVRLSFSSCFGTVASTRQQPDLLLNAKAPQRLEQRESTCECQHFYFCFIFSLSFLSCLFFFLEIFFFVFFVREHRAGQSVGNRLRHGLSLHAPNKPLKKPPSPPCV